MASLLIFGNSRLRMRVNGWAILSASPSAIAHWGLVNKAAALASAIIPSLVSFGSISPRLAFLPFLAS